MGEDRLQKAVNQRRMSDGLFLFLFGTVTALVLVTAEIALLVKSGAIVLYKRVRSIV